jgi:hypothetical protein
MLTKAGSVGEPLVLVVACHKLALDRDLTLCGRELGQC